MEKSRKKEKDNVTKNELQSNISSKKIYIIY